MVRASFLCSINISNNPRKKKSAITRNSILSESAVRQWSCDGPCGPERPFPNPRKRRIERWYMWRSCSRGCLSAVAGRPCLQLVRQPAALHMWRSTTMFSSVLTSSVAGSNGGAPNRTRCSLPHSGRMSVGRTHVTDHLRSMHANHTSTVKRTRGRRNQSKD